MLLDLPRKSQFKQDEVCTLTGVKPYVLRCWESEFEDISPLVSSSGQKLYEHKDIEAILKVKECLFERKMTIEQAKKSLVVESLPEIPQESLRDLSLSDFDKIQMAKDKLNHLLQRAEFYEQRMNEF